MLETNTNTNDDSKTASGNDTTRVSNDETISDTDKNNNVKQNDGGAVAPSKLWYVGHVFFWIITGLICYILWKERNIESARKHLKHSIWLGLLLPVIMFAIGGATTLLFGL